MPFEFCLVCINSLFLKNASACGGGEPRELGARTEAWREGGRAKTRHVRLEGDARWQRPLSTLSRPRHLV